MSTRILVSCAVFATLLVGIASGCIRDNYLLLPPKHPAMFVFGDSMFDAGNNKYLHAVTRYRADYSPYGQTFFGYPTGRATDGREYAKLPLLPPFLQPGQDWDFGLNFASIGCGALDDTHPGLVINLRDQLRDFKKVKKHLRHKLGGGKAKALFSDAVYLINIGCNDYVSPFLDDTSFFRSLFVRKEYVGMVIGNLTNFIQEIYKNGGRKFAFLNLSPIGCLPLSRASDSPRTNACAEELTEIAKQHNIALSQVLQRLESHLKDFKHSIHDFFTSVNERSENPSKYGTTAKKKILAICDQSFEFLSRNIIGFIDCLSICFEGFTEAKTACCRTGPDRGIFTCGRVTEEYDLCENPSDFLYFDSAHTTEKANEQISKLLWSGDSDVTGHHNLKSLFELDNKCRFNVSSE